MQMIALVSDQRMQNIIPMIQSRAYYDELVLVLSKERGRGQPAKRFVDAANDMAAVLHSLREQVRVSIGVAQVDPYDIHSTKAIVGTLIESAHDRATVIVNISGGTKPMAIGALQAAQSAGVRCVYTDTENGELIWLGVDGSTYPEPIAVPDLDVTSYIRAYGERIEYCVPADQLDPVLIEWSDTIAAEYETIYKGVIIRVMDRLKNRSEGYPIEVEIAASRRQKQQIAQLARQGLWDWDEVNNRITITNQRAADLINGGWVETYVAHQLQRSAMFQHVCLNIRLRGVEGEIDVAAIGNAKLVLIECKSNLKRVQQLSMLAAFRNKLGGPFAHAYYARAANDNRQQIQSQCIKFRLNSVFFGAELRSIGQEIGQRMRDP